MKCKLTISLFFVLLLSLFVYIDGTIYAIVILVAAFIHEVGHLIAMKLCHIYPSEINILPFGIEIKTNNFTALSYRDEIIVSLAGPIFSLLSAVLVFLFVALIGNFYGDLFFIAVSLLFFLVNLLPIESLDGGRVLKNTLLIVCGLDTGEYIANQISLFFTLLLFGMGLFLLYITSYNFSLALVGAYLLVKQPVWNNFFNKNNNYALQNDS